jgi:hypothetical protein
MASYSEDHIGLLQNGDLDGESSFENRREKVYSAGGPRNRTNCLSISILLLLILNLTVLTVHTTSKYPAHGTKESNEKQSFPSTLAAYALF